MLFMCLHPTLTIGSQFAVLIVLITAHPAGSQEAGEWRRFLGASYDGVAPEGNFRWTEKPELAWSLPVGDGYGIGTVADGKYFHFDATPIARGQSDERLRCIDLETGNTIWSHSQAIEYQDMLGYEDGPRSSPTIAGDHVYTLGVTGKLTCRSIESGQQIWMVDTNQQYGVVQNFFGVGCSPLVLGDKLITMVGGSPPEDQNIAPMRLDRVSSSGSAVVAFDRTTGKELWKCGDDLASYSSPRPIEIGGKTYVLMFARGGLMAIDSEQGSVSWRFDHRARILESVNAMVPVVVGDHVLISECYEVGSVLLKATAESAQVVWQDPDNRRLQSLRAHWATPIVIDGYLYGCSGRNAPDSDLRCIEFETGKVSWIDSRRIRSSVTRVGDHMLVLEERGLLQVIQPSPEELKVVAEWDLAIPDGDRPALSYPCWAAPIVVGDRLLLRGTSQVLCLRLAKPK
jgi:outer membrane protein assembly factor BamB